MKKIDWGDVVLMCCAVCIVLGMVFIVLMVAALTIGVLIGEISLAELTGGCTC